MTQVSGIAKVHTERTECIDILKGVAIYYMDASHPNNCSTYILLLRRLWYMASFLCVYASSAYLSKKSSVYLAP